MANATELIQQLGQSFDVSLGFSEQQTCSIVLDDDEVIFEQNSGRLYLIAVIGPAPDSEAALCELLKANYLGQKTGPGTLGIDASTRELVLHAILEGDLSYADFARILADFVQVLRQCKEMWIASSAPATVTDGGQMAGAGLPV